MPNWLKDAIFYEIYPQSFCDSNGDGIGDLQGIIDKLDYIREIGFNALWLNPCFLSPFMDAGYDVQDYYTVAPRYGTNDDLYSLFKEAHKRGMHVILDLVPGHTSDQCKWFTESCKVERNEYSDRYVWTNYVWQRPYEYPLIAGNSDRDGCYLLNFFLSQPALNYGFKEITHPEWQMSYTDKRVQATFEEMLNVMRFWLDRGCDGFRVDMADSLVKNDEDKSATASLWRKARDMFDREYPQAMLVSEWCNAHRAINMAGFHCDFALDHDNKIIRRTSRNVVDGVNKSYFCKSSHTSAAYAFDGYFKELEQIQGNGYISLISGNHDTPRISYTLTERETRLYFTMLLTLPGVPFVYYGDEIGMRYIPQPSKEGGYNRTGTRTPMQWDSEKQNLGFSTADKSLLYLDVDREPKAPCAVQQLADKESLLNCVRTLNSIRHSESDLQADSEISVLICSDDGVLCYKRGESVCVAFNPTDQQRELDLTVDNLIYCIGGVKSNGEATILAPQTAVIFKLGK